MKFVVIEAWNMKSVQNKSETKSTLKDYKENKDSEMVMEKDKKTNNISKPQFKCKTCGANFKKEITMNKYFIFFIFVYFSAHFIF